MKKTVSVFLTLLMLFALALPCFAENPAEFSINIISESDKELAVSVNYDGGSTFQNIDFELKYDYKKLKPTEAVDGDGLTEFIIYTKKNSGNAISMINKDVNPIKGVMATTVPFKVVQGKDLFVIKFQKLSKAKATDGDLSLKITNCQLDYVNIKTTVSSPWTGGTTAKATVPQNSTAAIKTSSADKNTDSAVQNSEVTQTPLSQLNDVSEQPEISDEYELTDIQDTEQKTADIKTNVKKAVWIPALVICILFVAVAAAVFINRKKENNKES